MARAGGQAEAEGGPLPAPRQDQEGRHPEVAVQEVLRRLWGLEGDQEGERQEAEGRRAAGAPTELQAARQAARCHHDPGQAGLDEGREEGRRRQGQRRR